MRPARLTLAGSESCTGGGKKHPSTYTGQSCCICFYGQILIRPGSSAGEESNCNAGDPSSIPGSGRSSGEGNGYPLKYSWASLVAQIVKNLPIMQETYV